MTGESFSYLGRSYLLTIVDEQDLPLRFDGHRFYLRREARTAGDDHFRTWYVGIGRDWMTKRVSTLTRRVGTSPTRIDVRDLGYRWGSCSASGALLFNWRLLQLPIRLADYVIIHELAHLVKPHHDPEFWRVLDRALPDWRERQEELRTKVQYVYWCHPDMGQ